jgi:hypothetical protein
MAISSRNNVDELVLALVYAVNSLQSKVVEDGYTCVHRDLTQNTNGPLLNEGSIVVSTVTVSAPSATNLASLVVLSNQLLGVLNQHMFDDQAHLVKDFTNQPNQDGYVSVQANLFADGGLAACIVNLNAMRLLFTAHLTQAGVHLNNDPNSYGLPSASTNLSTAETLANDLAAAVNIHMALAGINVNTPRIMITQS